MRMIKTLFVLGATVAGGLYLASPRARETRERLRGAYEILKGVAVTPAASDVVERVPRAAPAPSPAEDAEFTPSQVSAAADVALHLEHALEHGADGRARSEQQSRRPNVRMHDVRHS